MDETTGLPPDPALPPDMPEPEAHPAPEPEPVVPEPEPEPAAPEPEAEAAAPEPEPEPEPSPSLSRSPSRSLSAEPEPGAEPEPDAAEAPLPEEPPHATAEQVQPEHEHLAQEHALRLEGEIEALRTGHMDGERRRFRDFFEHERKLHGLFKELRPLHPHDRHRLWKILKQVGADARRAQEEEWESRRYQSIEARETVDEKLRAAEALTQSAAGGADYRRAESMLNEIRNLLASAAPGAPGQLLIGPDRRACWERWRSVRDALRKKHGGGQEQAHRELSALVAEVTAQAAEGDPLQVTQRIKELQAQLGKADLRRGQFEELRKRLSAAWQQAQGRMAGQRHERSQQRDEWRGRMEQHLARWRQSARAEARPARPPGRAGRQAHRDGAPGALRGLRRAGAPVAGGHGREAAPHRGVRRRAGEAHPRDRAPHRRAQAPAPADRRGPRGPRRRRSPRHHRLRRPLRRKRRRRPRRSPRRDVHPHPDPPRHDVTRLHLHREGPPQGGPPQARDPQGHLALVLLRRQDRRARPERRGQELAAAHHGGRGPRLTSARPSSARATPSACSSRSRSSTRPRPCSRTSRTAWAARWPCCAAGTRSARASPSRWTTTR